MDPAAHVENPSAVPVRGYRLPVGDREAIAERFRTTERGLAVATGFLLPVSTTLTNAVLGALVVCWLISGDFRARLAMIARSRVVLLTLALFALYAVGMLYTPVSPAEAFSGLRKYRNLLYVALLLPAFIDTRTRDAGLRAFELGMLLTLAASWLMWLGLLETKWGTAENCAVFKNYMTQNILMAVAVFLFARRAVLAGQARWFWAAAALLAGANVLFLVQGRSGYLILAALTALFLFQQRGLRGLAYAAVLLVVGGGAAYSFSSSLSERIDRGVREFSEGLEGQTASAKLGSSIGLRKHFYVEGARAAVLAPLFGHGTASFRQVYRPSAKRAGIPPTRNPHSEYLAAALQGGLLALGMLIGLLALQWHEARRLSPEYKAVAQGLVVALAVGCLVNAMLLDNTEGTLYGFLTAVCCAGLPPSRNS